MKIKIIIFLSSILFLAGCSKKQNNLDSYLGFGISQKEVDGYILQQMQDLTIPGISIAFINDGNIAYHKTYGYAHVEKGVEVNAKTIFEGASISKPVFSYFVMTYVEDGKLDLDKPLFEYLPYEDIENDERYKNITARMVLSHRSGFPNWREDEKDNTLKIRFEPGSEYLYSGEGYQYLALVLRHISMTDWKGLEKSFQEKVAIPLGLEHTAFIQNEYTRQNKAEPYDENGDWIDWSNDYWYKKNDGVFVAAASIHSEASDLSKWMIALMDDKILSVHGYNELFKPHSLVEKSSLYKVEYTLGFFHLDIPFTDIYFHGGNNIGFTSWFILDKRKRWGYVLLTNSEKGEEIGNNLLFFMFAGPDKTPLYLVLSLILIGIMVTIGFTIKMIITRIKRRHSLKTRSS